MFVVPEAEEAWNGEQTVQQIARHWQTGGELQVLYDRTRALVVLVHRQDVREVLEILNKGSSVSCANPHHLS